jgi:hypothetical protein
MIGLYDRDEIPRQFPGHIFAVDGIEFFAPQGSFATEKLAGEAIGRENGKYVVE